MLQSMQQIAEATPAPSSTSATFAGLLAALATPEEKPLPAWNDEGLADDVATLSYERALRAHARYRPAGPDSLPPMPLAQPTQPVEESHPSAPPALRHQTPQASSADGARSESQRQQRNPAAVEQNLKLASVTIRMSHDESMQLRSRAAEAGLTVSAYLRSCIFEVESLRAQVKEALAQMRPGAPAEAHSEQARSWWSRVRPHPGRQSDQA